jgi:O-antigen/teichoic acid export membrane protein
MTTQMSKASLLAINFSSQIVAFMINAGIQLFFTPYLIKVVGAEAFGFVGLSQQSN